MSAGQGAIARDNTQVWVLAASTGGVEAVARFLSLVECRDDVALVYVQHIFQEQHRHLLDVLRRRCRWPVCGVDYGSTLRRGWVTVPSAEERLDIDQDGLMGISHGDGWQHPYRPNIDEVTAQLLGFFGPGVNMIVFTGMGEDGCRGAELVAQRGGRVWVQSPLSCQASAMPEAVIRAVSAAFAGSIEELAEKFNLDSKRPSGH